MCVHIIFWCLDLSLLRQPTLSCELCLSPRFVSAPEILAINLSGWIQQYRAASNFSTTVSLELDLVSFFRQLVSSLLLPMALRLQFSSLSEPQCFIFSLYFSQPYFWPNFGDFRHRAIHRISVSGLVLVISIFPQLCNGHELLACQQQ